MKNTFGNSIGVTLFGESHGSSVGAVLDGLAPGIQIDSDYITHQLELRRPFSDISTARRENDVFRIESGVYNGKTTGTPLCIIIPNEDTHSSDYNENSTKARPGHADYTAFCKYKGFEDYRGGGHFSGRVTAALVAAGAIVQYALKNKGICIGTHIYECAGVRDRAFSNPAADIEYLSGVRFPVFDTEAADNMMMKIREASKANDSVGGVLETVVAGVPAGVGEPWFDSVESMLSHVLFSVPAVKGVEFGAGFSCAGMRGSEMNDSFYSENGNIYTKSNNNGGINGGITNGMPITFRCAVKPTPSIGALQQTVDYIAKENTDINIIGRHDPCIVHRARVVVDSLTAITLADLLSQKYGTDWLGEA